MIISSLIIVLLVVFINTSSVIADSYANGVVVDIDGNTYITGYTTVNLDGQSFGLSQNPSAGFYSLFIMKYSSDGTKLWTRFSTSTTESQGNGVTTDSTGDSIYVTGCVIDSTDHSWGKNIIVIKYTSNGTELWTRTTASASTSYNMNEGAAISVDSTGSVYVTGYCFASLDGESHSGQRDIFVMKYSSDGIKLWTRLLGTGNFDSGLGVSVDNTGVYVTGYTYGNLDGIPNISSHPAGVGLGDIVLTKYSHDGTKLWTRLAGGDEVDQGHAVTVFSSEGSVYVAGHVYSEFDGQVKTGSAYPSDIAVIKYSSDGTKLWTTFFGTNGYDVGTGITVDSTGSAYIVGDSGLGMMIGKLSSSGTILWIKTFPNMHGKGISVSTDGSFYVAGSTGYYTETESGDDFWSSPDFVSQILVQKHSPNGTVEWTRISPTPNHPTAVPTPQPSRAPTYLPTASPTVSPTRSPKVSSSSSSSKKPTTTKRRKPTTKKHYLTHSPSRKPNKKPKKPTVSPTV